MKHAGEYKLKLAKLVRKGLAKGPKDAEAAPVDPIAALVMGILEADITAKQAEKAFRALECEYVDFNELRVSPARDIVECIGEDYPDAAARATMIRTVLGGIFAQSNGMKLDYLARLPKRDLRRRLAELGLHEYASGMTMLMGLGMHAVPLDRDLAECLEMAGCVHPESTMLDVQGFVERAVPKQAAQAAHLFFRDYVRTKAKALAKRRKAAAEAQAAEAEAQAAAEAEQAKREAEKERAEKERAEKKRAAKRKATRKRSARKKTAKATPRARKKTAKAAPRARKKTAKAAPRARKKKAPARKTAEKTSKKAEKTTAEKAAKKTVRKAPKETPEKTAARKTPARSTRKKD